MGGTSGGGCSDDDYTISVNGIGGTGCDEHDEKCSDANGSYTFVSQGDGTFDTSPSKYVCGLYNWYLSCENNSFTLAHGAASFTWTGSGSGATITLTRQGTDSYGNCTGWPSSITLTRQ